MYLLFKVFPNITEYIKHIRNVEYRHEVIEFVVRHVILKKQIIVKKKYFSKLKKLKLTVTNRYPHNQTPLEQLIHSVKNIPSKVLFTNPENLQIY